MEKELASNLETLATNMGDRIKQLENAGIYEKVRIQFRHEVENFGSPSTYISELSAAGEISFVDRRSELDKIGASYDKLKAGLMRLDSSADHSEFLDQYQKKVVKEVDRCTIIGLRYMRDAFSFSASKDGTGGSRSIGGSSTVVS